MSSGRSSTAAPAEKTRSAAQVRGRKQDRVYEAIKGGILSGELEAGARLRIDEIGRELEVSHIPVREALMRLQSEGYVEVEPFVGATVTDLPIEWIEEVFELKESLELIGARAACKRMTDKSLAHLRQVVSMMDGLVEDPDAWSVSNVEMHTAICEAGGKPLTGRMLSQVLDQWDRLRLRYLSEVSAQRVGTAQGEHRSLLVALSERDEAAVERLVKEHNRSALQAYVRHLELID